MNRRRVYDEGNRLPAGIYSIQIIIQAGAAYNITSCKVILMSHLSEYPGNPVFELPDHHVIAQGMKIPYMTDTATASTWYV